MHGVLVTAHGILGSFLAVWRLLSGCGTWASLHWAQSSCGQASGSLLGSHGQAPSRAWGPSGRAPRQGSAHRSRAHSPCCRASPVHFLVRVDPEPLRAGPELTNSSSWTGLWPWASLCVASFQQIFKMLPWPLGDWAPVCTHHPSSPWLLGSSHAEKGFGKLLPAHGPVKMIRKQNQSCSHMFILTLRTQTCSLELASAARPIFCNYEPLMGEDWLTQALLRCVWIESL